MLDARFGLRLYQSSALLGGHSGGRRHPHHKVLHAQLCRRDAQCAGGVGHLGQRIAVPQGHTAAEALLPDRHIGPQLVGTAHAVGVAIVLLAAGGGRELDVLQHHLFEPGGVQLVDEIADVLDGCVRIGFSQGLPSADALLSSQR